MMKKVVNIFLKVTKCNIAGFNSCNVFEFLKPDNIKPAVTSAHHDHYL